MFEVTKNDLGDTIIRCKENPGWWWYMSDRPSDRKRYVKGLDEDFYAPAGSMDIVHTTKGWVAVSMGTSKIIHHLTEENIQEIRCAYKNTIETLEESVSGE